MRESRRPQGRLICDLLDAISILALFTPSDVSTIPTHTNTHTGISKPRLQHPGWYYLFLEPALSHLHINTLTAALSPFLPHATATTYTTRTIPRAAQESLPHERDPPEDPPAFLFFSFSRRHPPQIQSNPEPDLQI